MAPSPHKTWDPICSEYKDASNRFTAWLRKLPLPRCPICQRHGQTYLLPTSWTDA